MQTKSDLFKQLLLEGVTDEEIVQFCVDRNEQGYHLVSLLSRARFQEL